MNPPTAAIIKAVAHVPRADQSAADKAAEFMWALYGLLVPAKRDGCSGASLPRSLWRAPAGGGQLRPWLELESVAGVVDLVTRRVCRVDVGRNSKYPCASERKLKLCHGK